MFGVLGVGIACSDAKAPFGPAASQAPAPSSQTPKPFVVVHGNYDKGPGSQASRLAASSTRPSLSLGTVDAPLASVAATSSAEQLPFWEPTLGTSLNLGDDDAVYVPLGFTFTYYGRRYDGVFVGSNGYVTMNYYNTNYEGYFPQDTAALIAPATGDWAPEWGTAGNVYYAVVGEAPRRRFVVTWSGIVRVDGSGRTSTFQIQLLEGTNNVQFGYNTMGDVSDVMRAGIASGTGDALQIAAGTQLYQLQGKARCFVPGASGAYSVAEGGCAVPPRNRPPVATANGPYAGPEGAAIAFAGAATDADGDSLVTTWDFGDGSPLAYGVAPSHSYADDGDYTATLTTTDPSGQSSTATATVTVAGVAPVGVPAAPATVTEGSPIAIAITSPRDPSSADTKAGFQYAFDCGTGYAAFDASGSASCATSDNGARRVGAKIRDKDGVASEYAAQVAVENAAPVVAPLAPATLSLGNSYGVRAAFTDAGLRDGPWTYVVAWGDGSSATGSVADQAAPVEASHRYAAGGSYAVTLTVTDKDGGSGRAEAVVTVSAVEAPLPAPIEVKPKKVKIRDGGNPAVQVAVMSTALVDATTLDVASVRVGSTPVARERGKYAVSRTDLNGDGRKDLLLHFDRSTLIGNGDLTQWTTSLTLTGTLTNGRRIMGRDAVQVTR